MPQDFYWTVSRLQHWPRTRNTSWQPALLRCRMTSKRRCSLIWYVETSMTGDVARCFIHTNLTFWSRKRRLYIRSQAVIPVKEIWLSILFMTSKLVNGFSLFIMARVRRMGILIRHLQRTLVCESNITFYSPLSFMFNRYWHLNPLGTLACIRFTTSDPNNTIEEQLSEVKDQVSSEEPVRKVFGGSSENGFIVGLPGDKTWVCTVADSVIKHSL